MRQPVPFGKYLLLDRISVGGMAEVFKAKSYGVEGFEKIIAIKRILPTMGEDRDFIKMFIDEAKIAGQLAHANICQIFELGRIDGSHFIAMEYIWGKDLLQIQNRMRKLKQQMPIAMACFIIAKVLEGLDYAHRKRDPLGRPLEIVHRDCSPQNVLISYEGEVKVIDFGIAKATSRNSRTMAGVLKGKFGYMSPEQVRGLPLDRRSDLFALGTMLFECLTGERLFQGETDFSTLEKVRNVDIRRPTELNPAIPDQVERIILKALAKDVDNRYQWCSEMLADLQQFLMAQDVVFTAKTLSTWLKEGFAGEIDKERGLLEQYKRVGRDGLIAGLPAAEAKLDVVEHLGEAGQAPEVDATQLGGPSFDDIEKELAAIASPDGLSPGSAAARRASQARAKPAQADDDRDGDFGEEAPTEIFGEIEHGTPPAAKPGMPARPNTAPPTRPAPVAPRAPVPIPSIRPMAAQASPGMHAQLAAQVQPQQPPPVFNSEYQPPPLGNGTPGPQIQIGNNPPQSINRPAGPTGADNQGRTLMGAMAPPGVPNYAAGNYPRPSAPQPLQFDPQTGYPLHQSGQQPAQPYPQNQYAQHDSNQQPGMQQPGQYPSANPYQQQQNPYGYNQPQQGQYPSDPGMQGYQPPYAASSNSYPQQNYGQTGQAPAVAVAVEGRKKSSLGRDIAIGVVIAIVVLGGFLAVKFLVLDSSGGDKLADKGGSAVAASGIATLRISLPGEITAQLFIDDKSIGTFGDKAEVLTNIGMRKLKLVRDDSKCERDMMLEANKSNVFDCVITPKAIPAAGSGSAAALAPPPPTPGSATIPVATAGSGSAVIVATVGSGSAAIKKPDPVVVKVVPDKVPDKAPDKKPDVKVVDATKKPDKMPTEVEKKPPPAADKGYLEVFSTPKAKVLVDGVDTGMSTPISGKALPLTPGKHKITFLVGEDRFTFPATVKAGATEQLRKEFNQ